jgi:hypothetical protein
MDHSATAHPDVTVSFAPSAATWLKLSVVYLMAGVALGIAMGVMSYALASAAPDETDAGGDAEPDGHGAGGPGQHGIHG